MYCKKRACKESFENKYLLKVFIVCAGDIYGKGVSVNHG